jgi:cell division protein FtsZ
LVNISASRESLTMPEVTAATTKIYQEVHEDANIILGVIFDENLGDELQVTVIATGIRDAVEEIEELSDRVQLMPKRREPAAQPLPFRRGEPGMAAGRAVANGMQRTYGGKGLNEQDYDRPTFLRRNES